MTQKSNAQRFLDAFSQIEGVFKSWNKSDKSSSFSNYVHRYSKNHTLIKQYRDDLLEYSQLRNAIVHDRAGTNEIIAQPHDEVVTEIESIAQILYHPPLVKELNFNKLVTCQMSDNLLETLLVMNKMDYPQLPVLDGVMVQGLLTFQTVLHYMIKTIQGDTIKLRDVKVRDVMNQDRQSKFELVYEDQEIMNVIDLFNEYQSRGEILSAVILLNDKSRQEGPVGILTSRDFPRLMSMVQPKI